MNNGISDDPSVGNTNFPQQPLVQQEKITGGEIQTNLPENTQEGNTQTQFNPGKNARKRHAVSLPHSQKIEQTELKTPVWQKIGAGLKFAGKAIGVIALGALAIALLPLTIVGALMMNKGLDEANKITTPKNENMPSLKNYEKELVELQGSLEKESVDKGEILSKMKVVQQNVTKMKRDALPWDIMFGVGTVLAAPMVGAVFIATL